MNARWMTASIGALSLVLGTAPAQNAPVPAQAVHERTLYREVSGVALPYQAIPQRNPPCDGNRHVVVVDIDADGDLDLVIEPNGWRGIRIMLNDGDGRFVEETATRIPVPPVPVNAWRICVGDIDGDGDLDIAAGTDQGGYAPRYLQGLVYINDGTAHFSDESAARLPLYANYPFSLNSVTAMADFDRDGDLDLVLGGGFPQANYDRSIRLLRNDGRGYFTFDPSATPVDRGASASVSGHFFEYDIDGDGDMDIIGDTLRAGIALWLNDGTGRFSDGRLSRFLPTPTFSCLNVRAGDVDGDGDLDVVATRAYSRTVPFLYLNDGNGRFADVSSTHVDARGIGDIGLRMADFDADGDLDFLTTIQTNSYTYPGGENLFLNDGTGHFTLDVEQRMFPRVTNGGSYDYAIGDLDGDGDIDTVIMDGGVQPYAHCYSRYYVNTTRQTWAETRPTRGAAWQVIVAAAPRELALLAYGPLTARIVWPPLGTLRLDPGTLLVWPAVLPVADDGLVSTSIPIPDLPILQGLPLHAQALVLHANGSTRFTNLWSEAAIR